MQEYRKRVKKRGGLYLGVLDERWPVRMVSIGLLGICSISSSHFGDGYSVLTQLKERSIDGKIVAST